MKYVFVPIAVVGSGKSTTFRILKYLHPEFAHIENDNFEDKKLFYDAIQKNLMSHSVVLLDRNNHLLQHRSQIVSNFQKEDTVLVALVFASSANKDLRRLVTQRLEKRGANHQTIKDTKTARMVIGMFFKQFSPFDRTKTPDSLFDYNIRMSVKKDSLEENALRILKFLEEKGVINHDDPSAVSAAFHQALQYNVESVPIEVEEP